MKKSRLIEVFEALSKQEVQRLGKFLVSPYHNTREDVVQLYEHIAFAFGQNLEEILDKKYMHSKLFPQKPYKDATMRHLMSALLQLTEDFLAAEWYQQDTTAKNFYLAQQYRQRKLSKSFRQTIKTAYAQQEKKPSYSPIEQFRRSILQEISYQYQIGEHRRSEQSMQTCHDTLHHFFIATLLRQNCSLLIQSRLYKDQYESPLLDDALRWIDRQPELLEIPAVFLYYHSYKMLYEVEDDHHFQALKSGIVRYGKGFPRTELRDIYLIAINHCIRQANQRRNNRFLRELLDLYQVGLEQDAFLENGFLSLWTYKNVVTAGLILKEFEWVKFFIYEYESKLEKQHRRDGFTYNLAFLYHATKQYDKAISQLQQVKFDDVFFNLDARNLLLKIYLELQEYEALEAHLNSFEIFIRRKNITNPHRANYLNIIKLSRKIIQLNPHDKAAKATLRKEIEAEKNPSTRAFLLEILK